MKTVVVHRKRPKLGDIIEMPIPGKRFAYMQYVKHHKASPGLGALLRILPERFDTRPKDVSILAREQEHYLIFFALGAACHRGYVKIVGHSPIPERFNNWPTFRAYNKNFKTGIKTWFLWNGQGWRKIGKLLPAYYDLSFAEIPNLTELENRLAKNWMPRDET